MEPTGFYGCIVQPGGKPSPYVPPPEAEKLHISQASIEYCETVGKGSSLYVKQLGKDDEEGPLICLCTLLAGQHYSISLDLIFEKYTEFIVKGDCPVHISGYYMPAFEVDEENDKAMVLLREISRRQEIQGLDEGEFEDEEGDEDKDFKLPFGMEDGYSSSSEEEDDTSDSEDEENMPVLKFSKPKAQIQITELKDGEDVENGDASLVKSKSKVKISHPDDTDNEEDVGTGGSAKAGKKDKKSKQTKKQKQKEKKKKEAQAKEEESKKSMENGSIEDKGQGKKKVKISESEPQILSGEIKKNQKRKQANLQNDQVPVAKKANTEQQDLESSRQNQKQKGKQKATNNQENIQNLNQPKAKQESKGSKRIKNFENGFQIEDQEYGDTNGKIAKAGKKIQIYYTGKLSNGKIFDQSAGKPLTFFLGTNQVIKGLDRGLVGMRVGDKRQITIPPQMGYGSEGVKGQIPPNSTLVFQVELRDVK